MFKKVSACLLFSLSIIIVIPSYSQTTDEAGSYLNYISEQYEGIRKDTWDYTSAFAHSRSARKVERKRIDLLNTIGKSINSVGRLKSFDNDFSFRDSVISFLKLNYYVLNNDFARIIDMEDVAEQSYDLMEAYLLAKEKANDKLNIASNDMDDQYEAFANKYGVDLVETEDKLSMNLKRSSEALKYYNKIYLVFFKAYKQELYIYDALERSDINAVEQNRNALISIADEGMVKLVEISSFNGDNSINSVCNRILIFYKDEAETKIPIMSDYLMVSEDYEKKRKLFESKDRKLLTKEEVSNYNNAVNKMKMSVNKYNSTGQLVASRRNSNTNMWNNSIGSFMARHIPKK